MKTLHTVNKPGQPMDLCLRSVASGDTVLLMEDGIYALMSLSQQLSALTENCSVMVLGVDASARGVSIPAVFDVIDYQQFVVLSLEHDKVLAWF